MKNGETRAMQSYLSRMNIFFSLHASRFSFPVYSWSDILLSHIFSFSSFFFNGSVLSRSLHRWLTFWKCCFSLGFHMLLQYLHPPNNHKITTTNVNVQLKTDQNVSHQENVFQSKVRDDKPLVWWIIGGSPWSVRQTVRIIKQCTHYRLQNYCNKQLHRFYVHICWASLHTKYMHMKQWPQLPWTEMFQSRNSNFCRLVNHKPSDVYNKINHRDSILRLFKI